MENTRVSEAAHDLLEALEMLQKELHANRKMNVKNDFSLMVADAAASKAIAKARDLMA